MAFGFGCIAFLFFPISSILGFFRGRRRGIRGLQLQWLFYVIPIAASLIMGGATVGWAISQYDIPKDDHLAMIGGVLIQYFGIIAVPYIGGGIAGFYLGKRKRDSEESLD